MKQQFRKYAPSPCLVSPSLKPTLLRKGRHVLFSRLLAQAVIECGAEYTIGIMPDRAEGEKATTCTQVVATGAQAADVYIAMTLSLEQILMNDEIIGRARRVIRGIDVDEAHIGLETIKKVGPGGSFLDTDQTFAFMRSEYYLGNGMTHRDSRDKWIETGSKDAAERARVMVKKMLSETDETTIPDEVDRAIRQKYLIHMKS